MKDSFKEGRKNEGSKNTVAAVDHVASLILENKPESLPENVKRRLTLDLATNKTADYSRVNLTEVFVAFGCDTAQIITHWRIAKIFDGINFANRELKICKSGITPEEVETKVYKPLLNGDADKKTWEITPDPNKPEEIYEASLSDFAYLLDVVNANRNLGTDKQDLMKVVSAYFKGESLEFEISPLGAPVADQDPANNSTKEKGEKQKIDLRDQAVNPRDDYRDIGKDVKSYLDYTKDMHVQIGLQQMESWRGTSADFRVIGAHAYSVKQADGSGLYFIAISGRMAAEITLEDLQKGEKGGMMGQPQELGEMDEAETGAIVRFRLRDLIQRRKGGDVRSTGKTTRLAKAMLGLTLKEDPMSQVKTSIQETGGIKSTIHLCGEKNDGQIIKGMHAHYDKITLATRGYKLTDNEAADLAFTDVFAPCIINNENDWLTALSTVYPIGGSRSSNSLVQNKEKFLDFELVIRCRDVWDEPNMPIRDITFTGMGGDRGLRTYLSLRIQKGHIDQPGAERFASAANIKANSIEDKGTNEFFKEKIDESQGKKIGDLVRYLLGEYAPDYLRRYVEGGGDKDDFATVFGRNGQFISKDKMAKSKPNITFSEVLGKALVVLRLRGDVKAEQLLAEIYDIDFDIENNVDENIVVAGLFSTLDSLSKEERKKIV